MGKLKATVLPMVRVEEKHTSEALIACLQDTLTKFLLDEGWPACKIGGLTTDNASNMVKMGHLAPMFWAPCYKPFRSRRLGCSCSIS